jgi:two-component system sensor histidine kinase HydH
LRGLAAQASIAVENSRLYQRLKQRDRLAALGEMAAGLAHEIRNPLGAIKASAQFLAEPSEEPAAHAEFLGIIVEEVDRLNRVVSSFLDYARPQAGDPAPTDVNAVIHRTLQLLAKDLDGIEPHLELAMDLPRVRIDAERLRQVLINLGQNAAQAMAGQGRLTVATNERAHTEVDDEAKRWVELSVSDTGPGIPQKVLANLFVPFVTTKNRGTGLGLAITQRIVNGAGGHIEVRSHEGIGTTFVVRLPAVEGTREASVKIALDQSASMPSSEGKSSAESSGKSREGEELEGAGEVPASLATSR